MEVSKKPSLPLTAVDLFAGAGGWTLGLKKAGFRVILAVECDKAAAQTYRANHPEVLLLERDIRYVSWPDLEYLLRRRGLLKEESRVDLLVASPPCRPFSKLVRPQEANQEEAALWESVAAAVLGLKPRMFVIENVPGFLGVRGRQYDPGGTPWGLEHTFPPRTYYIVGELCRILWDYAIITAVWDAADYGVPQHRRRAFILGRRIWPDGGAEEDALKLFTPAGSRTGINCDYPLPEEIGRLLFAWPTPALQRKTASEALADLPPPGSSSDPLHTPPRHKPGTLTQIALLRPGKYGRPRRGVFARMHPNHPSPTITTGCYTHSKGGFVHPTENRAITLREAARLQTFPDDYHFCGPRRKIASQIGNAVPPLWAERIGEAAMRTLLSLPPLSVIFRPPSLPLSYPFPTEKRI